MAEIPATNIWDSRILHRLDLLGIIVALLVLGRLLMVEDIGWLAAATGALLLILLAVVKWPYGAFALLIAMSVGSQFGIELFGWNARPEHFAVGIVSVAFAIAVLCHKVSVKLDTFDYWILAYILITVFSSAFTSPAPASTLRWALQSFLAILPYFIIRSLVRDPGTLKNTFYILLAVGFAESCYGIVAYVSHHLFATTFGMVIDMYGDVAVPDGTIFEPNLFGAYTACCAVGFLALLNGSERKRGLAFAGLLVTSLAAFLSFSRAALLAFIVVGVWIFFRRKSSGEGARTKKLVLVAAVLLLVALALSATTIGGILQKRFADLVSSGVNEDTTIVRYFAIYVAMQDIPKHPIVGMGASSLQLSFDISDYIPGWDRAIWVGNLPIRILHDSGILGLAAITGFFISLWLKVRSVLRAKVGYSAVLLGLWAGAMIYLITFQATDGTILTFSWIHFGLLASAASLSPK